MFRTAPGGAERLGGGLREGPGKERERARLSPYEGPGDGGGLFGSLAGSVTIHGDIIAPVGEFWDAED